MQCTHGSAARACPCARGHPSSALLALHARSACAIAAPANRVGSRCRCSVGRAAPRGSRPPLPSLPARSRPVAAATVGATGQVPAGTTMPWSRGCAALKTACGRGSRVLPWRPSPTLVGRLARRLTASCSRRRVAWAAAGRQAACRQAVGAGRRSRHVARGNCRGWRRP